MKFRFLFLILIFFKFGSTLPVLAKQDNQGWGSIFTSVVSILPTWPGYKKPGYGAPSGVAPEGTGFYFNFNENENLSNYILTALHVIEKATQVQVEYMNGKIEIVEVVFKDNETDIAVLKSKTKRHPLKFSKRQLFIGDNICVVGNSFGLGPSLTCGVISALNRKNLGFNYIEDFIQIDAAVNPGDSGAPLFNSSGELIGMVDAIYTKEADIDAGVNFAINKRLIEKILKK